MLKVFHFVRRLFCKHYFFTEKTIASAEGSVLKLRCVRCMAVKWGRRA